MIATFIGHRDIEIDKSFYQWLKEYLLYLIDSNEVNTFLFGSKSQFDTICLKAVTELKEIRPHIKSVYVRAEYQYINEDYKNYLLTIYDETYMPDSVKLAGKASYVKRNFYMIDISDICIFYYDENYVQTMNARSGTKIAYHYAVSKQKSIINLFSHYNYNYYMKHIEKI